MGKVLVIAKVLPSDISTNLDLIVKNVKSNLPKNVVFKGSKTEEIAFGLKALKLYFTIPDNIEGGTSVIEDYLKNIHGIDQVEIEFISLIKE